MSLPSVIIQKPEIVQPWEYVCENCPEFSRLWSVGVFPIFCSGLRGVQLFTGAIGRTKLRSDVKPKATVADTLVYSRVKLWLQHPPPPPYKAEASRMIQQVAVMFSTRGIIVFLTEGLEAYFEHAQNSSASPAKSDAEGFI